jgi:hypothetical protein
VNNPEQFSRAHHESPKGTEAAGSHVQASALQQSEAKIEGIVKHDPNHAHMSEVYKELDSLRSKDKGHFSQDLEAINKKLHQDGLLPHITIIQDRQTGPDGKEHTGYSMIADDPHNPGHRVGSEVGTSHPRVADTPASAHHYRSMRHGQHGYNPGRDSAEGGRAAGGGYDGHLNGARIPKGEHKDLIDKALQIAGVPVTPATEAAMNKIITRESGWNPNIVNTWDSNARRGDPSKGLMQVIHSTFEQHRDKSLPDSQTDPLANMVAALHYMGSRYGHGNIESGLLRVASRSGGY